MFRPSETEFLSPHLTITSCFGKQYLKIWVVAEVDICTLLFHFRGENVVQHDGLASSLTHKGGIPYTPAHWKQVLITYHPVAIMKKICLIGLVSTFIPCLTFAGAIELPRTGQTSCYNASGNAIACYSGTSVTLTATPDSGSTFAGCSGGCSGRGTCSIPVNANTQLTADFSIKGDVNSDGAVDLADAIIALHVISRMTPAQTVNKAADVNGDGRIGMEEAIFILQWIAGLRGNSTTIPIRGIYVQFERRGWASGYWSGDLIHQWNDFDSVVGHTVAEEAALQLDAMKTMGVNTIAFELRAADSSYVPDGFTPANGCNIPPSLGLRWPQPTSTELTNLQAFFDLVHSKEMRVLLRLVNTHMEEQPPTNSQTWLGSILQVVKDHPAFELVSFEGNTHLLDTDGDGTPDACGGPAEPPLYLGPTAAPAQYVKWAIGYGRSLGIPTLKLTAEAIIGDFFTDSQPPAGPTATDSHLWSPIVVLKAIFDDLGIPANQRTYAVSFYEHRKCDTARTLPCVDTDPHSWADQTLQSLFATIGTGNGARVVAVEMGVLPPISSLWPAERALASLVSLFKKYGVDGGAYWRWVAFDNAEDANPDYADAVKRRGVDFIYNPVQQEILHMRGIP